MTSPSDGDPLSTAENRSSIPALDVLKAGSFPGDQSPEISPSSLSIRALSPPTVVSRKGSLSSVLSRSSSPNGRLAVSLSRFGRSQVNSPLGTPSEAYDDTRSLITRAFSPTVAIYAAPEVDELARNKGLKRGFIDLIRPYGNRIPGKVVVRDSAGASRAWEDFAVHFVELGQLVEDGSSAPAGENPLEKLEELMEYYTSEGQEEADSVGESGAGSLFYRLFLTRLLCSRSMSPHESFRHPVGAVIAISSSTKQPIDTLRNLYQQTSQGSKALPIYANPEYLRYYVLVHDDDRDDFSKSSALFDQMKRHFGLHCHLLRLRSTACTQSDDDTEEIPASEWLSASEQLTVLTETADLIDLDTPTLPYIHSSDVVAIQAFVRELVAQSIVYHMEQRITLWNEQIASRRRGISGRFMSLSKRWTSISGSSRGASSSNSTGSGASGNYDSLQGMYRYDAPESLLRKLADYAFMLRDYKLAASTYELLRSDFANDKAWKYLAGANEMSYVATLLHPLTSSTSSKFKVENFDQMLETASYSYLTRCNDPVLALRAILLGVELLKVRGRGAGEIAAKWAIRSLELGLVGSISHVLISERVTSCFADRIGTSNMNWGTRKRKAALWSIMSADEWMKLGRADIASERLEEAEEFYSDTKYGDATKDYPEMAEFLGQLRLAVRMKLGQARNRGLSGGRSLIDDEEVDETVEEMTTLEKLDNRVNRRSLMGGAATNPLEGGPRSPVRTTRPDPFEPSKPDDDFE